MIWTIFLPIVIISSVQSLATSDLSLLKWVKDRGIVHPKVAIDYFTFGNDFKVRGLVAIEDIEPDEPFITIPETCTFKSSSMNWIVDLSSQLLHELNERNSKFEDYLRSLPTLNDFRRLLPMYWHEDSCIGDIVDFSFEEQVSFFEGLSALLDGKCDDKSWALHIVQTRNVRVDCENYPHESFNAIIPFVDLMNHNSFVHSYVSSNDGHIQVCHQGRGIKRGEQIFLNYGCRASNNHLNHRSAEYFLCNYGFVPSLPESVANDYVEIILPKALTTPYLLSLNDDSNNNKKSQVINCFQSMGIRMSAPYPVSSNACCLSLFLLAAGISQVETQDILTKMANRFDKSSMIDVSSIDFSALMKRESEAMSWDMICSWIQQSLSTLDKINDDRNENIQLLQIIQVRREILRNCLVMIAERLRLL